MSPASVPRLLYVVSEDWYFLSHRLPMARAARAAGYEVHVATRVVDGAKAIEAEGFRLHAIPFARGGVGPLAALRTIAALRRIHRNVRPVLAHHVALQAAVFGSLAAIGRRTTCVNALTGFGFTFISENIKARLLKPLIVFLLRFLCMRGNNVALVQNPDDRNALLSLGIAADHIALIPGSGVDVERLQPSAEPAGTPTVAFVGRLLEDKGIRPLVAAIRQLQERGTAINLLIAGDMDPANPSSVKAAELHEWTRSPGITWAGHVNDISEIWAKSHIAALPSRREGLPKALLEAAACGRPMVATDVPGCREVVIEGKTGLLVRLDDRNALADAIGKLAASASLRARYGAAARILAVEKFSAAAIGRQTMQLYDRLLASSR
ncbi:MAG TPA: glycosyltransferase family 4 protein [Pseudolabrys sp.]|nr:glycosyltransferase family 4 protein [Pseudolabrys sp.]